MKMKKKIIGVVILAVTTVFLAAVSSIAIIFETLDREDN